MYRNFLKRLFDVILAIILMVILFPVFLICALAVKLDSEGPIIFKQERSGKDGKVFKMCKFRSMVKNNDVHDLKCEDKVTKVGAFLRSTSLDEIPQLYNILKGEMSFIGPRPWITDYSKYFTDNQRRRLEVRPGLTGLAQCSGRNDITIREKIDLDVYYVDHLSFWMDVNVIIKTIQAVISRKGIESNKSSIQKELNELKGQIN